jgi:hypothetical protein
MEKFEFVIVNREKIRGHVVSLDKRHTTTWVLAASSRGTLML